MRWGAWLVVIATTPVWAYKVDFGPMPPQTLIVNRTSRAVHSTPHRNACYYLPGYTLHWGRTDTVSPSEPLKVAINPYRFRIKRGAQFSVRNGAVLLVRDLSSCKE